jgi:hypothetical protein
MSVPPNSKPHFPEALSESLFSLKERGLITPNMLSEYVGSQLFQTAALTALTPPPKPYQEEAYTSPKTHTCKLHRKKNGVQTLTATAHQATRYQIYFAGNVQDALEPNYIKEVLQLAPNKNHIFWDYPGACRHEGIKRFDVLFKCGYKKVKYLLNTGVPAKDITLYGYSMGGGIAAHIARKLHEEGHPVNLTIDRSFSSLSAVVSPLLYHKINTEQKKHAHHLPLGSAIAAFAITGVSIGTALAGLITSIGVLIASLIAGIGYTASLMLSLVPGFMFFAKFLNTLFNAEAQYLNTCFDVVASTIGSVVALAGFILGALTGLFLGTFLSLQHLFTKNPCKISLKKPTRMLLNTTTGEMDSVNNVQRILSFKQHGKIKIINSKEDEVIRVEAALNTGLNFTTNPKRTINKQSVNNPVASLWYNKGSHIDTLQPTDIDEKLTLPRPPLSVNPALALV